MTQHRQEVFIAADFFRDLTAFRASEMAALDPTLVAFLTKPPLCIMNAKPEGQNVDLKPLCIAMYAAIPEDQRPIFLATINNFVDDEAFDVSVEPLPDVPTWRKIRHWYFRGMRLGVATVFKCLWFTILTGTWVILKLSSFCLRLGATGCIATFLVVGVLFAVVSGIFMGALKWWTVPKPFLQQWFTAAIEVIRVPKQFVTAIFGKSWSAVQAIWKDYRLNDLLGCSWGM